VRPDRSSGIEADEWCSDHQGIGRVNRIGKRILDHEHAFLGDCPIAEGLLARGAADMEAASTLKDLALLREDCDESDWHLEQVGRKFGDGVELRVLLRPAELIFGYRQLTLFFDASRRAKHGQTSAEGEERAGSRSDNAL
jgi:hypothetical protein